jgi:hypothetical protein
MEDNSGLEDWSLLQVIRRITYLCNPSHAADDFPRCVSLSLYLDLDSK